MTPHLLPPLHRPDAYTIDVSDESEDVEIKQTVNKGRAVFAKRRLPANGQLDYGGVLINATEKTQLLLSATEQKNDLAAYLTESGDAGVFEDAHYRHKNKLTNKFGGVVNEPDEHATANMVLTINSKQRAAYVTVEEIAAGKELTGSYGDEFARLYTPGQPAQIPEWL